MAPYRMKIGLLTWKSVTSLMRQKKGKETSAEVNGHFLGRFTDDFALACTISEIIKDTPSSGKVICVTESIYIKHNSSMLSFVMIFKKQHTAQTLFLLSVPKIPLLSRNSLYKGKINLTRFS